MMNKGCGIIIPYQREYHDFHWPIRITTVTECQTRWLTIEAMLSEQFQTVNTSSFWELCREYDFTLGSNWLLAD